MSGMKPFKELISFEEAKLILLEAAVSSEETEAVELTDANGRVLAGSIVAEADVPGFTRGAMDGYAVRAEDTLGATRNNGKVLKLTAKIFAGQNPEGKVEQGTCMQIATGAPMPEGADAVVMVEETEANGDNITIFKPVYPGGSVSNPDSDIAKGTRILEGGTVLGPPTIGVLAALGYPFIEVCRRPNIAICPTGEEVVTPGEQLGKGKIYDINSYTLATLLEENGAEVDLHPIAGDSAEDLRKLIAETEGDILVFSGGSSVGERDLLAGVIEELGELLFHGIALKPGKPTICGRVDGKLIMGMPGYPTSCLSNAYVLLGPAVRKMAHLSPRDKKGSVILTKKIFSTVGRHQIYMVKIEDGKATPVFKESGAITSMSLANAYLEIPANVEFVEEGVEIQITYL